jgi:hypothetical protein
MHVGPFNSQCLIMDNPRNIVLRVIDYLQKSKINHNEVDHFTVAVSEQEHITVESLQAIVGFYIIKFTTNQPLTEAIIEHLNK